MTTPTPRTDAIKLTESGAAGMLKDYYDLCGQLERELLSCNVIKDNIRVCAESLERDLAAAQERAEKAEALAAEAAPLIEAAHAECVANRQLAEKAEAESSKWQNSFHAMSGRLQAAEARVEALIQREKTFRALIADDAYAASFQSLGQFRTAILGWIDERNDIDAAIAEGK